MSNEKAQKISFELSKEHHEAISTISAGRKVRLSGEIRDGKFVVDNVAFANASFSNPLFVAVNAPFTTARAQAA
jgi:hypothetical protein